MRKKQEMKSLFLIGLISTSIFANCLPKFDITTLNYTDPTNAPYRYGPFFIYDETCRKAFRRASVTDRGLEISRAEMPYWRLKDEIQDLRDEIRKEMILHGFLVMDQASDIIDPTLFPKIARKIEEVQRRVVELKSMAKKLAEVFKNDELKKEAYIEQGLILDIKDQSFKMSVSFLRSKIIQDYLHTYDQEIIELRDTLLNTKDPAKLRETLNYIIDTALNDKRDPKKHYRHFLNNQDILNELYNILMIQRGKNDSGVRMNNSGKKDIKEMQGKITVYVQGRAALELFSIFSVSRVYSVKGQVGLGIEKPIFSDYDGRLLYTQMMAIDHSDISTSATSFPESAKTIEKKESSEKIFDITKFTKDERTILTKTKSLSEHPELISDISKLYDFYNHSRPLFE